jgi:hypothetical protein
MKMQIKIVLLTVFLTPYINESCFPLVTKEHKNLFHYISRLLKVITNYTFSSMVDLFKWYLKIEKSKNLNLLRMFIFIHTLASHLSAEKIKRSSCQTCKLKFIYLKTHSSFYSSQLSLYSTLLTLHRGLPQR